MISKNFYDNFIYDWWKNLDKVIFFLFISLIILGLFFSLVSTSLIASSKLGTNNYYFFIRHLIYICLGLILIFFFSALEEKDIYKIGVVIFIIFFLSLLLVPFFGVEVKGSKRWLDFPIIPRFQPIEFLKPFLIIFLSLIIGSRFTSNNYLKFFFKHINSSTCFIIFGSTTGYRTNFIDFICVVKPYFCIRHKPIFIKFLILFSLSALTYLILYLPKILVYQI